RNSQSLKMARATKQTQMVPVINQTIGSIYLRRRQLTKAEKAYKAVLRAFSSRADEIPGFATAVRQLGSIAADRGKLGEAEKLYVEALDISRKLNSKAGIADNLHNLGIVAQEQDKFEQAREYYEESLKLTEQLGDERSVAISLHQLGVISRELSSDMEAR